MKRENDKYRVVLKSTGQMLCSDISDFTRSKTERGECLFERM